MLPEGQTAGIDAASLWLTAAIRNRPNACCTNKSIACSHRDASLGPQSVLTPLSHNQHPYNTPTGRPCLSHACLVQKLAWHRS